MSTTYRVAFLGLRALEREMLDACLRLTQQRTPRYERVANLDEAELLVADADDPPAVQLVVASERLATTVFVGAAAPAGAAAWVSRPIDTQQLLREMDGLVVRPGGVSVDLPLDIQTSSAVANAPLPPTACAWVPGSGAGARHPAQPLPQRCRRPRHPRPPPCWLTTAKSPCVSWKPACGAGAW